jgi:uncharacterized protein YegP (UPF0339 family)
VAQLLAAANGRVLKVKDLIDDRADPIFGINLIKHPSNTPKNGDFTRLQNYCEWLAVSNRSSF